MGMLVRDWKRKRAVAGLVLIGMISGRAISQSAATSGKSTPTAATSTAAVAFDAADVHVSPHSNTPFMRGGQIIGGKYEMRYATMEDLIAAAYGVYSTHVYGGPPWLEWDKYDIIAKAPATTTQETTKLMLRSLLADRFKLVAHSDTKPLPAIALTMGKGKSKLTESSGDGAPDCEYIPPAQKPAAGMQSDFAFTCKNVTMEYLVSQLGYWGYGYYTDTAVVDQTGLKGGWDFDIHWSPKGNLAKEGADGISIFDAVDKQLGLLLGPTTTPQPVMVVDSVNEMPTPNVANLDQLMPPWPPAEFEVATIRPSRPDETINGRVNSGQVSVQDFSLNMLIDFAWEMPDEMIVGAPKSVNENHYDITAKADVPPPTPGAQNTMGMSYDDLMHMLQVLITERFNMKSHMEDRPMDAYTLVAASPKLTKADPANYTACKEGPGADGKDPRITNPIMGRLLTCHNITMAEFAEQLQTQASGFIKAPVLDATGITGRYDFTLSFSSAGQLKGGGGPTSDDAAPDPSGGLSLFDAINKQMGLKLVKQKRPVQVLVIDHIDDTPTEN